MATAFRNNSGFTLIEAIVVLLIIGIISAVVASHVIIGDTELSARTEAVKVHIRYAQSLSMNTDMVWGIHREGKSYWLFKNGNKDIKVLLPGADSNIIDLSADDISLSGFTDLSFNSWGIPHNDQAAAEANRISTPMVILLTLKGETKTITVTPNTGFVP